LAKRVNRMPDTLHLFVLVDALGWRYVENEDFLRDYLPVRRPLKTVLGYSAGAIPTILTGRMPAETGHWNLFYYDPSGAPFRWLRYFRFVPRPVLDNCITRRLLTQMGRRMLGLGPLFDCAVSPHVLRYFNWSEKRNIYLPGGIEGARSIFDELFARGIPYRSYSYHRWTDQEILERALADLRPPVACFYFLYLSELDGFLHHHCLDTAAVRTRLRWYADRLRAVFAAARRIDPASGLTLFSDHGMAAVRFHHDLAKEILSLGLREPEDYLAVYDSTMARFWFRTARARGAITARLAELSCGRVLSDEELRRLGVLFPDQRYGDLIFLLNPGWMLHCDFHGSGWMPTGMHGYHPDDPDSDGVLLSDGQHVRHVASIADLFDCMLSAARLAAGAVPACHEV